MTEKGKFVVFEGVGGSGKTVQAEKAADFLNIVLGEFAGLTREPGGLKEGEIIRRLIFQLRGENLINTDQQIALFFASRAIWLNEIVIPDLVWGRHVIADRSYPSTAAYQGYGEGGDINLIEKISKMVMGEFMPDGIILLDVTLNTARERNFQEDDPFDNQGVEYLKRVMEGYRDMADKNWSGVPWHVVDANKPLRQVEKDVQKVVHQIIRKHD